MSDLKRIIILCLPSLLFAATMEPGKRSNQPNNATSLLIILKCFFCCFTRCCCCCHCFEYFFTPISWIGTSSILELPAPCCSLDESRMIPCYEVFYHYWKWKNVQLASIHFWRLRNCWYNQRQEFFFCSVSDIFTRAQHIFISVSLWKWWISSTLDIELLIDISRCFSVRFIIET